jgi:hypothetical protein
MPRTPAPIESFEVIAAALVQENGVTLGAKGKKGFGSSALQVGGHIFAMVSSRGEFVVKLPKPRVAGLVEGGVGHPFDPGYGRLMKEWFSLEPSATADRMALAREAMAFVRGDRT